MRTLGVVLAGGRSSRFGSDKAEAQLFGRTLLDHALDVLRSQCNAVAVVGRAAEHAPSISDWPGPGRGPLGGLAGALRYAAANYDQVLSVSIDSPLLPSNLLTLLGEAPVCLINQPVIGLWPADAARSAEAILCGHGKHSMRAFVSAIGARMIDTIAPPANINRPEDLLALERGA